MAISAKDGSALLSELTDDAVFISNLFDHRIEGRDAIVQALHKIEALYKMEAVAYRHRTLKREFIFANLILTTGEGAEVMTVGVRDDSGWICAMSMEHAPMSVVRTLRRQLQTA